jgi:hypothetical protein
MIRHSLTDTSPTQTPFSPKKCVYVWQLFFEISQTCNYFGLIGSNLGNDVIDEILETSLRKHAQIIGQPWKQIEYLSDEDDFEGVLTPTKTVFRFTVLLVLQMYFFGGGGANQSVVFVCIEIITFGNEMRRFFFTIFHYSIPNVFHYGLPHTGFPYDMSHV